MITIEQYFGAKISHRDVKPEYITAAIDLLARVNKLIDACGVGVRIDPDTGTQISGSKGGSGDGGFRLQSSKTGAPTSTHKTANGVDPYDPDNALDNAITDELLEEHGLWREHPDSTPGWCHLQRIPPRSGKRTYNP